MPGLRGRHATVELLEALGGASDFDATTGVVHAVFDVLLLGCKREQCHLFVVVGGEDEVGSVTRRSAGVGQWTLVDQHHVGPSQFREMTNQTVADDACADDDALGATWELAHVLTPLNTATQLVSRPDKSLIYHRDISRQN